MKGAIGTFNSSLIEQGVLFIGLLVLVFFIVISIVLDHHWRSHGVTREQVIILRIIYYGVSGFLIFTMVLSFLFFKF